ncbi:CPBP family intramembrane metalloprotease [Rhodophyticola sp. CCM32]|uniref:CPBP family intramembrane glutamic endopeptidase n=1 Tax=Rhodophyticola sp. CCM32 TaxID=2916397 RepID=UPI00107F3CE7|nr:CPBP family intramembrane glutamic endopeptidase [Rhodophyticola sp. CCM32]QBY02094.1 CPBP family intramembrane metalloprotease [Rhodophyticola sp. CCM32]
MQYPEMDGFVAPARAFPQLWRLLVGLVVAAAVYIIWFLLVLATLALTSGLDGAQAWLVRMGQATSPTGALLVLATFPGMALGPIVAAWFLHHRPFGSLLGPYSKLLRQFLIAAMIAIVVFGLSTLIPTDIEIEANLMPTLWLSFLPLALVGVLIQTGAEEVLFRGYLQQQLAARFTSPLIWMLLPSALFAIAHFDPVTLGDNAWLVVAATGLFGLFAADLTARTGSIGAAWGFHFANNLFAMLLVALDGPLSGLALYTTTIGPEAAEILRPLILRDMGLTAITWLMIRFVLTR